MRINDGGGTSHEEENIEVLEITMGDAMKMISTGEIKDAKTIILLQHVRLQGLL